MFTPIIEEDETIILNDGSEIELSELIEVKEKMQNLRDEILHAIPERFKKYFLLKRSLETPAYLLDLACRTIEEIEDMK